MKLCIAADFSSFIVKVVQNTTLGILIPHFEEVRGGVEPWSMARWKALAEFLLSVIELIFLSLTVEALQCKTCQSSQPSGVGRSLGAKISGRRCRPWIFFGFYKTRHILLSSSGNCTVLYIYTCRRFDTIPACDGQTDRQTDGIAVYSCSACNASIARAVKSRYEGL